MSARSDAGLTGLPGNGPLMKQFELDPSPQIDEAALALAVLRERTEVLAIKQRTLNLTSPVIGGFLVYLMYDFVPSVTLLSWWLLISVFDGASWLYCGIYLKKNISLENRDRWKNGQLLLLILCALIWGSSVVVFHTNALQGQLYNYVILVGVSSVCTIALMTAVNHSLFSLLPAWVFFLWLGDVAHFNLAIGIVLMAVVFHLFRRSANGYFTDAIEQKHRARALKKNLLDSFEKIKEMAIHDEMTGLYNRNFGMVRLQQEANRNNRHAENLSIVLIDIDHFKNINDTYGHNVGDTVLVAFVKRIQPLLRGEDTLFRYGGEEFLVILPNASLQVANLTAQRLRKAIESSALVEQPEAINVTASFGVSEFIGDESVEFRIGRADAALYDAKHAGRNNVQSMI